jgi:hypothetical protein
MEEGGREGESRLGTPMKTKTKTTFAFRFERYLIEGRSFFFVPFSRVQGLAMICYDSYHLSFFLFCFP